jgi:hypothetical protein
MDALSHYSPSISNLARIRPTRRSGESSHREFLNVCATRTKNGLCCDAKSADINR